MKVVSADFLSNQTDFGCKKSLLIETITSCLLCGCKLFTTMSVVPQGILVVKKIRQNEEKVKNRYEVTDLSPTKYSSKYMNSIWGMYNRYSVHNLKKNFDENIFRSPVQQQESVAIKQTGEKNSTDLKGSLSSAKNFLSSANFLY